VFASWAGLWLVCSWLPFVVAVFAFHSSSNSFGVFKSSLPRVREDKFLYKFRYSKSVEELFAQILPVAPCWLILTWVGGDSSEVH